MTRRPRVHGDALLDAADLSATWFFALEGALAAIAAGLDLLGVFVLAVVTSSAGGIVRDVLIGDIPPVWVRRPRFVEAAFVATLLAIALHAALDETPAWLLTGLDAAGLALFAVAGAAKSLDAGIAAPIAALLGVVTGVGGGTVRDVLLNQVPVVLYAEIYAVAALAGAVVVVLGDRVGTPRIWSMPIGAGTCFGVRVLSAAADWHLPRPGR